jgi:hypothetical protein
MIAVRATLGCAVMKVPAVAAASIHAFGLTYWNAADCQKFNGRVSGRASVRSPMLPARAISYAM